MTPADTAKNEAAKQAVALAFMIAGAVLLVALQRKMGGGIIGALEQEQERVDPTGAQRRRMESARKAAKRWDRASTVMFRYGPARAFSWAWGHAEAARKAYDAERP